MLYIYIGSYVLKKNKKTLTSTEIIGKRIIYVYT